jgi:23S rRNA pseudouridine2605 synthase
MRKRTIWQDFAGQANRQKPNHHASRMRRAYICRLRSIACVRGNIIHSAMAKSVRGAGKGRDTHYNRKEEGKGFNKGGGRSSRPGDKDKDNDRRPARKADEDRKPSFRKKADGEGFKPRRESTEGRKPFRRDEAGDKPFEQRSRSVDRDSDRPTRKPDGDRRPPFRKNEDERGPKPRRDSGEGKRPFRREEGSDKPYERKSFGERNSSDRPSDRPFKKREEEGGSKPRERKPFGEKKNFKQDSDRPFKKREEEGGEQRRERKPFGEKKSSERSSDRPFRKREEDGGEPRRERKPTRRFEEGEKKPFARKRDDAGTDDRRKSFNQQGEKPFKRKAGDDRSVGKRTKFDKDEFTEHTNPGKPGKWNTEVKEGPMTLNKYLAHAGVSSRRDAAAIIKEGKVQVNGQVLTEPGYRVQPTDKVTMDGKMMKPQKHFVYVLLNKPKDFLTTTEDDRGRRTVMELVAGATEDRLYPVGRLDRNTTGVLLLTNDGDLAQKLSHPKYESKKIYQVTLDKEVTKRDFDQILEGVTLEDGVAMVDRLAYLETKNEIGLEIHSGRNRIVRRIFESLGYQVEKLDRVMYAGLTKKNVSRGKWRFLTEKEVIALKHFRT